MDCKMVYRTNFVMWNESEIDLTFHLHSVLPGMISILAQAMGVLATFTVGLTNSSDDTLRIQKNHEKLEK